jgi:hypothetical protein
MLYELNQKEEFFIRKVLHLKKNFSQVDNNSIIGTLYNLCKIYCILFNQVIFIFLNDIIYK